MNHIVLSEQSEAAQVSGEPVAPSVTPQEHIIAERAHEKWCAAGRPHSGPGTKYRLEAEAEIKAEAQMRAELGEEDLRRFAKEEDETQCQPLRLFIGELEDIVKRTKQADQNGFTVPS